MSSKNKKRYIVEMTIAETWDGKGNAPNVEMMSERADTIEDARLIVQNKIGSITTNTDNKLEWIGWLTTQVEIKFNYPNEGAGRVHETLVITILEVDENGKLTYMGIGD